MMELDPHSVVETTWELSWMGLLLIIVGGLFLAMLSIRLFMGLCGAVLFGRPWHPANAGDPTYQDYRRPGNGTDRRRACRSGPGHVMRSAGWLVVAMIGLLFALSIVRHERRAEFAAVSVAERVSTPVPTHDHAAPVADLPADGRPPWTVEGGPSPSRAAAIDEALSQAQRKVRAYLYSLNPSLDWTPSLSYIQNKLVRQDWKEETKEIEILGEKKSTYRVVMQVEVTPDTRRDMLQQARGFLVQQRMIWLGKILAVLVVLLAAVAGYLRLDESTKGFYTTWLRVAAVGLVAVVGLGLLFLA
jgi:hypothetical protein